MVETKPRKLRGKPAEAVKQRHPTILVYGKSGQGKTWFTLDWPDIYFIDAEGGATQKQYREKLKASGGLYIGPDEGAASFDVVLEEVRALATTEHDRKTLVIDSMTKLFANEIAREAERLHDAGKKNEFGADKKPAVNYMRQLVSWITRMDMNVILICGETAEWGLEKGERVQVGSTFDCWPRLEYELDLAIEVYKVAKQHYARVRKSRVASFEHGKAFDLTYNTFAEMYGREALEGAAQAIACATPEQLAEINRLLEVVKLEEGTVDKWLAAANVSSWDEMATDRAAKAIDHLKSRLAA